MATTNGITFSGFNDIDFSVVLNSIMQQESQPLTALQSRQTDLKKTDGNYALLATKLATLKAAADDLSSPSSLVHYSATSSDTSAVATSASTGALPGRYEVVVSELARAQVTASSSTTPDSDTTIVATGGTVTIGSEVIAVSGPVTLRGLASQINADASAPATASIVETSPGAFRLVLSSKSSGVANSFTVQNALTATTIAFTDTNGNGISGDSALDNAVAATDAALTINGIPVTSSSNTLTSGIPGTSVTLLKKDPLNAVVVEVGRNDTDLADRVGAFVSAFNDIAKFASDQEGASSKGATGTLGRDALLHTLRNTLRGALNGAHGSAAFTHLSEVGIGFSRTGELTFDRAAFSKALATDSTAVQTLFTDTSTGAFSAIGALVDDYSGAGGLVPGARTKITQEISRVGRRLDDLTARLAIRRLALQQQFTAADQAITRLKSQQSALGSFATNIF